MKWLICSFNLWSIVICPSFECLQFHFTYISKWWTLLLFLPFTSLILICNSLPLLRWNKLQQTIIEFRSPRGYCAHFLIYFILLLIRINPFNFNKPFDWLDGAGKRLDEQDRIYKFKWNVHLQMIIGFNRTTMITSIYRSIDRGLG